MDRMLWLKERKTGLGGTDVAAILGLSKYKTPYTVWKDKTSDVIVEIPDNANMKWGRMLEGVVAQAYTDETGREVQMVEGISRSKEYPFMIGSIDRFIVADPSLKIFPEVQREEGVLEVKTAGIYAYQDWEDAVPAYYYAQLMHYLYVTGLNWGAFAILVGGSDFRIFPVTRDEEFIASMVAGCVDFWINHVQTNTPPPKEASDYAASKLLLGSPILASTEVLGVVTDLSVLQAKMKADEAHEKALKATIQKFMGEHDVLAGDHGPLATWKLQKGVTRIDEKRLADEQPSVYSQYTKTGDPYRVFRLKIKSEVE